MVTNPMRDCDSHPRASTRSINRGANAPLKETKIVGRLFAKIGGRHIGIIYQVLV
jgi:hypothetical protein